MVQISAINGIKQNTNFNFKSKNTTSTLKTKDSSPKSDTNETDLSKMPNNYVSFKAGLNSETSSVIAQASYHGKLFITGAQNLAKEYKLNDITPSVMLLFGLTQIKDYIEKLNSGETFYDEETSFTSPQIIENDVNKNIFKSPTLRAKIAPIINNAIIKLDERIKAESTNGKNTSKTPYVGAPGFTQEFLTEILSIYKTYEEEGIGNGMFHDSIIFSASYFPYNDDFKKEITLPLRMAMKDAVYINSEKSDNKIHLSFYDKKAEDIWKNISIGTNMVILTDNNTSAKYFINSMQHLLENKQNGVGKINKDNTEFVIMNDAERIDVNYLNIKFHEYGNNKNKNYVVAMNITDKITKTLLIDANNMDVFKDSPNNIKFVFIADKSAYNADCKNEDVQAFFENVGEAMLPVVNLENAKKMFAEQPKLMEGKPEFTKKARNKCIEVANNMNGCYPDKALRLMDIIASNFVNKAQIQLADVNTYLTEAKDTLKLSNDNQNGLLRISDSDVKISDLVGKPTTKQDAQIIVKNMKNGTIGTKGYLIYSISGGSGSGRKYTAKAIAGSSKSPYIEFDANELLNPDINQSLQNTVSPEKTIKNIFEEIKAQADTNPTKSAVLFIENFDEFSESATNPYLNYITESGISEQDNKYIIKQFVKEMNRAQEQGYNIVILGSLENEQFRNQTLSDSFKFIDEIVLESPTQNSEIRAEIIDYFLTKKNIKLAGNDTTQSDIKTLINRLSSHLSYLGILTLLDKAQYIAIERQHSAIEKGDFTEAYLQLTTGKVSKCNTPDYRKKITASHECGHAINATIMENYAKHFNNPSYESDKINFITLDPRGNYGGAVYSTHDNSENSFEHMFSNIVLDFGGTSCEKEFYNQDGSWGITSDMAKATERATLAAGLMGQGKNFGKKSLDGMFFVSEEDKNNINKDINVILKNAQVVSETIVKEYRDFIEEFTQKYYKLVETGECIIHREEFLEMLEDWKSRQSDEKKAELEALYDDIAMVIEATKNGIICTRADA